MKRFFVFLVLLAVLPAPSAWARIKIISQKVFVTPVAVQNKAISKADAAILTIILVEGIPKYCRQIGNPSLTVVSTEDSATVVIRPTVINNGKGNHDQFYMIMVISLPRNRNLEKARVRVLFPEGVSVIDESARMLPDIVREYIEPTILGILNP